MDCFISPEPVVRLKKAFTNPFKNLAATARTCYSDKGIIEEDQIGEGYERLARSIYKAGHHTTLQHAHFQFSLANVSRQFVWSFLHSHPFYNSEQVSQRYVAVKAGNFVIPPLEGKALSVYEETVTRQFEAYEMLIKNLKQPVSIAYFDRFKGRARNPQEKKTQD